MDKDCMEHLQHTVVLVCTLVLVWDVDMCDRMIVHCYKGLLLTG